jgi:hypothetical protein
MHHEQLVSTYTADSSSLLSWTRVQSAKFSDEAALNVVSTDAVKELIESSNTFKNTEKPEKQQNLAATEALLANLRLSQRNNERPMHAPEIEVDDLETEWAGLEKAEQAFEDGAFELRGA